MEEHSRWGQPVNRRRAARPDNTEYPVHKVTLNTFYIGETGSKGTLELVMKQSATILNTISLKAWSGTTFNLLIERLSKQRD